MYNEKSQLEIDFVRWLGDRSKDVDARYYRTFYDAEGNCDDFRCCIECLDEEIKDRTAAGNKLIEVDGWNEAMESDCLNRCDRCQCILEVSPTLEYIRNDIEWLSEAEGIDGEDAWSLCNWLTGMGDYRRDEHWPLIAPHAARLMEASGVDVVPDGYITYRPAFPGDWYEFDSVWLGIYQWFAEKLIDWKEATGDGDLAYLQRINDCKKPCKVIAELLKYVGKDCGRGRFLASIGLSCIADLEKPIRLVDNRCEWPDFDVRGRVLLKSPNKYHPKARTLTHSEFVFCSVNKRWCYDAYYDYNHYDRSSWAVSFYQKKNQTLPEFTIEIKQKLEKKLIPCNDRFRSRRLEKWDAIRKAVNTVFYLEGCEVGYDADIELTDLLIGLEGPGMSECRIIVDKKKMSTLKRWLKSAAERKVNSG